MGICLVTKLKSEVINDNLHKLGEVILNVNTDSVTDSNAFTLTGATSIRVIGDGFIGLTSSPASKELTISNPSVNSTIFYSAGTYKIGIVYVYDMYRFTGKNDASGFTYTPGFTVDMSFFRHMKLVSGSYVNIHVKSVKDGVLDMRSLNINTIGIVSLSDSDYNILTGNIEDLATDTNLGSLNVVHQAGFAGSINTLGNCKRLTTLLINDTNVSGDLVSLAQNQVANGRTEGVISITAMNSKVKNNGATVYAVKSIKFGISMVNPTAAETAQGFQIV